MALQDTYMAIGAVTETLISRFVDLADIHDISVGRPDESKDTVAAIGTKRLNLFLYEIHFDEHLKNTPLNEGEKPPLWLVLKYMITAYNDNNSNDIDAQKNLGAAMRAVSRDDLFRKDLLEADPALGPNPEQLHVTFDEASSDLLSKLMQGTDEQYRLSFCFQVRPVMIAPAEPGDYSLLVGIDYTTSPSSPTPSEPLRTPVGIDIIASMGPHIDEISPGGFELGEEVTLRGTDMHLANLSVMLGSVELPVNMQQPDELRFTVEHAIIDASGISAGSYPITVVQTLPATGKKRKSNPVIGNLVPTLRLAAASGSTPDPNDAAKRFGTIDLLGTLLGQAADDTILAFYKDGVVHKMFDEFTSPSPPVPTDSPSPPPPPVQPQPTRQLVMDISKDESVAIGRYKMILIVNGQQAPQSPEIELA